MNALLFFCRNFLQTYVFKILLDFTRMAAFMSQSHLEISNALWIHVYISSYLRVPCGTYTCDSGLLRLHLAWILLLNGQVESSRLQSGQPCCPKLQDHPLMQFKHTPAQAKLLLWVLTLVMSPLAQAPNPSHQLAVTWRPRLSPSQSLNQQPVPGDPGSRPYTNYQGHLLADWPRQESFLESLGGLPSERLP